MKWIICLILLMFLLPNCNKDSSSTTVPDGYSRGQITGMDARLCPSPCCGGWFIKINDNTYYFGLLPSNSSLDLSNPSYPVNVILKWEADTTLCTNNGIKVLDIRKE
ncbi:MAG: hypothetical protein HXX13_08375 [Bacteroidetes bacterium]|nr:hypothetical protein [Bacteroidota bacterium]